MVGANSFVMGDIESDGIYAGSPAKLIRKVDVSKGESESGATKISQGAQHREVSLFF